MVQRVGRPTKEINANCKTKDFTRGIEEEDYESLKQVRPNHGS